MVHTSVCSIQAERFPAVVQASLLPLDHSGMLLHPHPSTRHAQSSKATAGARKNKHSREHGRELMVHKPVDVADRGEVDVAAGQRSDGRSTEGTPWELVSPGRLGDDLLRARVRARSRVGLFTRSKMTGV